MPPDLCFPAWLVLQFALLLSSIGNLSAQSAPSVLPPQQTLHPPGCTPETGQNHLLQPLKPSPSSENLYSAFTSDGTISIPGQGKHTRLMAWWSFCPPPPPPNKSWKILDCISDYHLHRWTFQAYHMFLQAILRVLKIEARTLHTLLAYRDYLQLWHGVSLS